MEQIKAIETFYADHYFRSRLEARWAVYFDSLGIQWIYEHEGYVLSSGVNYLPDFYLPALDMHVEIKPHFDLCYSEGLIQDEFTQLICHQDYRTKWFPFSICKKLTVKFGLPGFIPSLLLYGADGVVVENENAAAYQDRYKMGNYKCYDNEMYEQHKDNFNPFIAGYMHPEDYFYLENKELSLLNISEGFRKSKRLLFPVEIRDAVKAAKSARFDFKFHNNHL